MLKRIAIILSVLVSTSAHSGVIGTGGINANENPEVMEALRQAEKVDVRNREFIDLSKKIDADGVVNAEVKTKEGKLRRDFIKVRADGSEVIVDTEITKKLNPLFN